MSSIGECVLVCVYKCASAMQLPGLAVSFQRNLSVPVSFTSSKCERAHEKIYIFF